MAQANQAEKANTALPEHGDHDRVVMLSLKADGSADQHAPEIIGDKAFAEAAAKRQFAEQAVSSADVAARGVTSGSVTLVGQEDGSVKEEPARSEITAATADLKKDHDAAAEAAEKAAAKTVASLTKD